jgi:hypothetical protein
MSEISARDSTRFPAKTLAIGLRCAVAWYEVSNASARYRYTLGAAGSSIGNLGLSVIVIVFTAVSIASADP